MKLPFKKKIEKQAIRQPRFMQGQDEVSFRRSRTLTGSKSSEVKAANESRGELKSERLKKQQLKKRQQLIMSGLLGLIVAIGVLYYLLSQYVGQVRTVTLVPSVKVSSISVVPYQASILEYLQSHPGERFRFALSSDRLSQYVAQKYPEIQQVRTTNGDMGHGDFELTLRRPIAGWKIGEKQYFVDDSGEAFERNYYDAPAVNITDNSGAVVGQGDAIASRSFLRFLGRLVALTNASGLGVVTEASLPPNTTREIDIKIQGRGYTIKTHTDRDPASEVEDMKRVVGYLEQRHINPQYIDVRVEGRAFYR